MTDKRKRRAEAVERLEGLHYKTASDMLNAMLGWGHEPHMAEEAHRMLIDLLTDEDADAPATDTDAPDSGHVRECPQSDVAEMVRKAARGYEGGTGNVLGNLRQLMGLEHAHGCNIFDELADMIERERDELSAECDEFERIVDKLTVERDEWRVKAQEEKANADAHWRNANRFAEERDEWKARCAEVIPDGEKYNLAPEIGGASDTNRDSVSGDTREKLEADVRQFAQVYYTTHALVYDEVIKLLDRQAAITERHWMEICGANTNTAIEIDRQRQEAVHTAHYLEAFNDELRESLVELGTRFEQAERERDRYRDMCGRLLDVAQEMERVGTLVDADGEVV